MKLLMLDTSTESCSAALCVEEQIIYEATLAVREHGSLILPMIARLLAQAQLSLSQLDAIAFGRGPGSFTGLRIAASVTQGIAVAHDLPVIAISSLQTLAQGAKREFNADKVLCAIDARMHEVYWGCYELQAGVMQAVEEECVAAPQNLALPTGGNWYGVGTGWQNYATIMQEKFKDHLQGIQAERYPLAQDMFELAKVHYNKGELLTAAQALPVYLRNQITQNVPSPLVGEGQDGG